MSANDAALSADNNKGKGKGMTVFPTLPFMDGRGEELAYRCFHDERTDLAGLTALIQEELSEPYNVYTFRYFLADWPHLTFFVYPTPEDTEPIATIICKQEPHRDRTERGYIGMLSVHSGWRRRGIARKLVELAVREMEARGAQEVVLETEYDNRPSLALYEALGFVREKRLHRFYSNGKDAYRLILPLNSHPLVTQENSNQPPSNPEIGFILAGPGGRYPSEEEPPTDEVARLSLKPERPPRPDYIS